MTVMLTNLERQHLRQLQKQRRDEDGYVKVYYSPKTGQFRRGLLSKLTAD